MKILFILSFLISCTSAELIRFRDTPSSGYVVHNVRIFSGRADRPVQQNMDVHIQNGVIQKISKTPLQISDAREIDGKGKVLLPGLIDFHTHITAGMFIPWKAALLPTQDFNLEAAVFSGITTIVDMSGKDVSDMNVLKKNLETGKQNGPHLYHAGIGFTAKGGHPVRYLDVVRDKIFFLLHPFIPKIAIEMEENTQDFSALEKHLAGKPDFTKVYVDKIPETANLISDDLLKKITEKSHLAGVPVVLHIGNNANLASLISSGADGAVHSVYKEKIDPVLVKKLASSGIYVVPTIVVWDNFDKFKNKQSYAHYTQLETATTYPDRLEALKNPKPEKNKKQDWEESDRRVSENIPTLFDNVRIMKKAGVKIVAGSDSPNYGISIGGSLHVELQNLVKAGFTPAEAIQAATYTPASILDKNLSFGTVEEGKRADLLLVEGDPLKNIKDTENIAEVFVNGKRIERFGRKE